MKNCKIQVQPKSKQSTHLWWSMFNLTRYMWVYVWVLVMTSGFVYPNYQAIAGTKTHSDSTSQKAKIEQPLPLKLAVTLGGVALIAAEVWWFLLSTKPASGLKSDQSRINILNIPKT